MIKKTGLSKLLPALALLTPFATLADSCDHGAFSDIYVLGDSLADQGNLFQATTTLTGTGSPADDHYFSGRFSNGEVYTGLLAEKLGGCLTASSSDGGGTNFAYGGTRTNYNIVENPPTAGGFTPGRYPWTLNLQRQAFVDQAINDPHGLYIVFSGSNDMSDLIGRTIVQGFAATKPMSDQAVQGIRNSIQAFIDAGARDILVPNLPDLGVVPRVFTRNPPNSTLVSDTATALATRYNQTLDQVLDEIASTNDVNIIRFDTFSFLREVVGNPAAFGLSNATEPCYTGFVVPASPTDTVCDTPEAYVFWDNEHPTTAFHAVLANQIRLTLIAGLLDDLRQQVIDLDLHKGIERSLLAKLAITNRHHGDEPEHNGHALHAFIHEVKAQRSKKIAKVDANALIDRARQIKQVIEPFDD
ncbi:SGNH/GDSL hydrolase family protein [Methylomonas montana]|uniref:SGNH/GDSL hydrolase family protein n=1 Tax=Methylomonas montana TaxID=3058963 RepID=UPI002659E54C|nr:SGNH/GDSL hydrolase family protein [Methylomonas montana]WKJ90092.1 SGNH/GDSL hydrolase family protein [Methylomonas montana]